MLVRTTSWLACLGIVAAARAGKAAKAASCEAVVAHTGTSVGSEVTHDGVTLYVSKPQGWQPGSKLSPAVLYLTDVFGIQLAENRLLADSFARAGFLTVAPDLFSGSPAPADLTSTAFNTTAFLARHGPEQTDPIIAKAIAYLRSEAVGAAKIGATGYCYGGRYAFRVVAQGGGADMAFAAHPSLLGDDEIRAIKGPASVAAAETDNLMNATRRAQVETLLRNGTVPYQVSLYGGTSHGFGVRANVSDVEQRFAKEAAFYQAVRWFEYWGQ